MMGLWLIALPSLLGLWLWMREKNLRKEAELALKFTQELTQKIPLLEAALKKKEEECAASFTEQRIAEEKVHTLKEAQEQLKTVFHALSSEALEKNNRSFLDLAKTSLEKYQEGAKGDLEKRQTAISELLTPIKENLLKLTQGSARSKRSAKGIRKH